MAYMLAVPPTPAPCSVFPAVWQAIGIEEKVGGQDKRTASRLVLCGWDYCTKPYGTKPGQPYPTVNSSLFSTLNRMARRP